MGYVSGKPGDTYLPGVLFGDIRALVARRFWLVGTTSFVFTSFLRRAVLLVLFPTDGARGKLST